MVLKWTVLAQRIAGGDCQVEPSSFLPVHTFTKRSTGWPEAACEMGMFWQVLNLSKRIFWWWWQLSWVPPEWKGFSNSDLAPGSLGTWSWVPRMVEEVSDWKNHGLQPGIAPSPGLSSCLSSGRALCQSDYCIEGGINFPQFTAVEAYIWSQQRINTNSFLLLVI